MEKGPKADWLRVELQVRVLPSQKPKRNRDWIRTAFSKAGVLKH